MQNITTGHSTYVVIGGYALYDLGLDREKVLSSSARGFFFIIVGRFASVFSFFRGPRVEFGRHRRPHFAPDVILKVAPPLVQRANCMNK